LLINHELAAEKALISILVRNRGIGRCCNGSARCGGTRHRPALEEKRRLMSRLLLDTNVIVRFLTGDHPAHSGRSRDLFTRAAAGDVTLVVTDLALAETVWVLQSFYRLDRDAIAAALKDLIESAGIEVENKAGLQSALRNFAQTDVDFVDAYHAAVAAAESVGIASFDRDFDQFKSVKRVEPRG
jgi:predicted nucleic acid-binding protein